MLLQDFKPPPDLADLVQLFRIVHLRFGAGETVPPKAYPPRPEHCLAFYPYEREMVRMDRSGNVVSGSPVVLYGQFTEVSHRYIGRDFLVLQVVFWPGAMHRLTGMPAIELTNQYVDAVAVFGSSVTGTLDAIANAKGYLQMLDTVYGFLRGLRKRQSGELRPLDRACMQLLGPNPRFGLREIAREACLSPRQMERVFKASTGVNPKLYERIIRFDKAFRIRNARPDYTWLRIAMECDYHDYQHLVKAYRDFTGKSPNAFHELEQQAPERKFGLVEGYYE
jgi:AraC-like DNA-binding protein